MNIRLGEEPIRLRLSQSEASVLLDAYELTITISWLLGGLMQIVLQLSEQVSAPQLYGDPTQIRLSIPAAHFRQLWDQRGQKRAAMVWSQPMESRVDLKLSLEIDIFNERSKTRNASLDNAAPDPQ